MSDKYPGVIDVGGAMWAATTAPSRLPNTHKVVPLDAIVIDPSSPPPGGGPAEWAEWAEVTADLRAVSTSHAEAVALARQAVEIGKAGGISDEKLAAVLHLAAAGMTPTALRLLRDAGIDTEAVVPRSLAEVSAELGVRVVPADAVVIEASTLPKVRNERGMRRYEAGGSYADWDDDPEYFEERAREYLALAARLREESERRPHVTALTALIARDWAEHPGIDGSAPDSIARRLVDKGVRVEGVES